MTRRYTGPLDEQLGNANRRDGELSGGVIVCHHDRETHTHRWSLLSRINAQAPERSSMAVIAIPRRARRHACMPGRRMRRRG